MRELAVVAIALIVVMGFVPLQTSTDSLATCMENPNEFTVADAIEPPEGLVSWWPGDGNADDIAGPNHGTLGGETTFAPGMVGDAFSFDGDQDMVWLAGDGIDGLQELTIEAWVRHESPLAAEVNRYITLGGEKAVLRHDDGNLDFYMNLGAHYYSETSSLVIPDEGYNPFTGDPIDHSQFSFITITGLQFVERISLSAEFTNADSDFMAWPGDMNPAEYSYENNIMGGQMASAASPEQGGIGWVRECDSLVVGCFDYSLDRGDWTLNVATYGLHRIWAPNVLEAYRWLHVVGTYDGDIMRLYLDGVEVGNHAFSGLVSTGFGVMFNSDWGEELNGLMDEISIYDRALSLEEIQAIYNAGADGKLKPEDDYYVYSHYYQDAQYATGVGGWVPDYGDPNVWGDEEQYLYFLSGSTGYQVRVSLSDYAEIGTDPLSPGWIEPHQHPDNPYATGPIEPRHFEDMSSADLSGYTDGSGWHSDEFHVDERGIFLGAWPYGIFRWDHNWNDDDGDGIPDRPPDRVADPPPVPPHPNIGRTETLAYNPDDDVWYAGARDLGEPTRRMYQASDSVGDDGFYETWEVIFSYPGMNPDILNEHHDGLDYAGGSVWISDMFSDRIAQWTFGEEGWFQENIFEYTEWGYVEGMGFGPNNHLWGASGWKLNNQLPYLYEFGGGELQKELPPFQVFIDIKPESWPNPINLGQVGVLPVAISGTEDFDVTTIDPGTIVLAFEGADGVVSPLRWSYEDVATPFVGDPFDGHDAGSDGYVDLVLHFDVPEVVDAFSLQTYSGLNKPFYINANLKDEFGGAEIQGKDYAWILGFFGDIPRLVKGHYYAGFFPHFNEPHYIKTGTWLTIGFGLRATGETAEVAEQTLRSRVDSTILGATFNGAELNKLDSGFLWKYLNVYYDEANNKWVAHVPYRYYVHPQAAGTYEIYWSGYLGFVDVLLEETGYVTWYEG